MIKYTLAALIGTLLLGTGSQSVIPVAPANVWLPEITGGTDVVGQTLSVIPGVWNGTPTPTYTCSWHYIGGSSLGTNCSSYGPLVSGQIGNNLQVDVTATNSAGSKTVTSEWIGPIEAALPAAPPIGPGTAPTSPPVYPVNFFQNGHAIYPGCDAPPPAPTYTSGVHAWYFDPAGQTLANGATGHAGSPFNDPGAIFGGVRGYGSLAGLTSIGTVTGTQALINGTNFGAKQKGATVWVNVSGTWTKQTPYSWTNTQIGITLNPPGITPTLATTEVDVGLFGQASYIAPGDTIYIKNNPSGATVGSLYTSNTYSTSDGTPTGTPEWTWILPDPASTAAPALSNIEIDYSGSFILRGINVESPARHTSTYATTGFMVSGKGNVATPLFDMVYENMSVTDWAGHSNDPWGVPLYPNSDGHSDGTIQTASPYLGEGGVDPPSTLMSASSGATQLFLQNAVIPVLGSFVWPPGYYRETLSNTGVPPGTVVKDLNGFTGLTNAGNLSAATVLELTGGTALTGTLSSAASGIGSGTVTSVGALPTSPTPPANQIYIVQATPSSTPSWYEWNNPVASQWNLITGTSLPGSGSANQYFVVQPSDTAVQSVYLWGSPTAGQWNLVRTFLPVSNGTTPEYYAVQTAAATYQAAYGWGFTLTGTGFGTAQLSGSVSIGGVTVTQITAWSNTSITGILPAGAPAPTTGNSTVMPSGGGSVTPTAVSSAWVSTGTFLPATATLNYDWYTNNTKHLWVGTTGPTWTDEGLAYVTIGTCTSGVKGCPSALTPNATPFVGCDPLINGVSGGCNGGNGTPGWGSAPVWAGTTRAISNEALLFTPFMVITPANAWNHVDWAYSLGGFGFQGVLNASPNDVEGVNCISVKNNTIRWYQNGMSFAGATNFTAYGNRGMYRSWDFTDFQSVHRGIFANNFDSEATFTYGHMDFIQLAQTFGPNDASFYGIAIVDNESYTSVDPNDPFTSYTQGIDNTDQTYTGTYAANNVEMVSGTAFGINGLYNTDVQNDVRGDYSGGGEIWIKLFSGSKAPANPNLPTYSIVENNLTASLFRDGSVAGAATNCAADGNTISGNISLPFIYWDTGVTPIPNSEYCNNSNQVTNGNPPGVWPDFKVWSGFDYRNSNGNPLFVSFNPIPPASGGILGTDSCLANEVAVGTCTAGALGALNLRPSPSFAATTNTILGTYPLEQSLPLTGSVGDAYVVSGALTCSGQATSCGPNGNTWPAGLYIRANNNGNYTQWTCTGALAPACSFPNATVPAYTPAIIGAGVNTLGIYAPPANHARQPWSNPPNAGAY